MSSSQNLHLYRALLEADLSYDVHTKQSIMSTQGYTFENDPSKFSDLTNTDYSRRHESCQSGHSFNIFAPISDNFLNGVEKSLIPGVEVRIRLTRTPDNFFMLMSTGCLDPSSFTLKNLSATLFVYMLELRSETHLSIERALTKEAATYD